MSVVPRVVARNWRLKLAAFGLAVFLWAVVRSAPESGATSVPMRVEVAMGGDSSWVEAGPPEPAEVDVHVRGSFADIERLRSSGASIRVPLDGVAVPDTVVTLQPGWVGLDGGLSVDRIEPAEVRLSLEEAVSAAKPVSLRPTGELPADLALAQPLSPNPVVVTVRGPASRVRALDSIPALGPDLSQVEGSGVVEVPLDTAGSGGLVFTTASASVTIRVEPAVQRIVPGVPVVVADLFDEVPVSELVLEPTLVEVTLRGGQTRVGLVEDSLVEARVDGALVQTMRPGELRVVPLRFGGVPELVAATARPDSVEVRRRGGDGPNAEADGDAGSDGGGGGGYR